MFVQELSDGDLAVAARAGNDDALDELYRRFVPAVTGTARRLLRASSDVDDVVQETFLIAFEKLAQLDDASAVRAWICRIAFSRAHRRFRSRELMRTTDAIMLEQMASSEASPEQRAELALIARALALPFELRVPWALRHVVGAGLEDIAESCACSLATAKRRIAKAEAVVSAFCNNLHDTENACA